MAETPFDVFEEQELGDLSGVKQERILIPPTNNVRVKVNQATVATSKNKDYRQINVSFRLTEGLGEKGQFKNSVVFERMCYWANPEVYEAESKPEKSRRFFKNKQHLVLFTQLLDACGVDKTQVKFGDALLTEMAGKEMLVDIGQKPNKFTAKDGTEVDEMQNVVRRIRSLPTESQV